MDITRFAQWETPAQPTPGPWIRWMRWQSFAGSRTCGSTWTRLTEDLRRGPKPPGNFYGDCTKPIWWGATRTSGCTGPPTQPGTLFLDRQPFHPPFKPSSTYFTHALTPRP